MSCGEFLSRYVHTGTAVLLKGLVDDWAALRRWTPGYLAAFAAVRGEIEVPYRSTPPDMPRLDMERVQRGMASLLGILEECRRSPDDGPEIYVPGMDLPQAAPLARDVGRPSALSDVDVCATTVFLGRNTKCIGHFHPKAQALLCQVQGVKRVWMYSPAELKRLSLFPVWSESFFRSQVNFYGDRSDFPALTEAKGELFELHPGDALFLPLHWLHVPEGRGWNVSVTQWWRPRFRDWRVSTATGRALVGIGFEYARRRRYKLRSGPIVATDGRGATRRRADVGGA